VRLVHPGRGHTDGDLVALFVEDRLLHAGDLVWNKRYPNIDLEPVRRSSSGGTLDRVLALDFDTVIRATGSRRTRTPSGFQGFLRDLLALGRDPPRAG